MKPIIKKFDELNATEIYEIFRLRSEVFVVEQKCIYKDFDDKDKSAIHIFYEKEKNIIAYLRVFMKTNTIASFGRVCVKKENRKEGLGKKIVNDGLKYIRNNYSYNKIYIEAQEYLKNFYESFGFVKTSKMYLDDGIPHIDMEIIENNTK